LGGLLNEKAGKVDSLDDLAVKFISASKKEQESLTKTAESIVSGLPEKAKKTADYYVKAMNKIAEKEDFLTKEKERLTKMLTGSIAADKADEFTIRLNILSSFKKD